MKNAVFASLTVFATATTASAGIVASWSIPTAVPAATTGGTNRIDNIVVNGDAVPGPGELALPGPAGLATLRRR